MNVAENRAGGGGALIIFYTQSKIIAKKLHLIDMLTNFIIVGIMIQLFHSTEILDNLL